MFLYSTIFRLSPCDLHFPNPCQGDSIRDAWRVRAAQRMSCHWHPALSFQVSIWQVVLSINWYHLVQSDFFLDLLNLASVLYGIYGISITPCFPGTSNMEDKSKGKEMQRSDPFPRGQQLHDLIALIENTTAGSLALELEPGC